jgi:hypothetical protein
MLSRRLLLTSSLALLGGCAARAVTVPPTNPPASNAPPPPVGGAPVLVGPHPTWTGQAGSGATAPVDPTRTTAKPMASWWTPTLQRFTDDFIVGVIADAKGGVASVEFSGDCATTSVTAPSVRTYTDPNGVTKKTPLGYWIALDHSQFVAVNGATSKINLYAKVTANDGTMQVRVIGGTNVDASDNVIQGKLPQQHFPRTTQYDWVKTIGVGGDFATWAAMRTALKAAAPKSPHVTFITTATYDCATLVDPNDQWAGTEGYCVVDAAPGVTATLVRGLTFDRNNTTPNYWDKAWYWFPGCNQIKFTGAGVVVDTKNYNIICQTNNVQPFWFDGCKVINSIGTMNTTYFNGGPPPSWATYKMQNNPAASYVTDCYTEFQNWSYGQYIWANNQGRAPGYGVHNQIRLNVGNYERGATCEYQYYGPARMTGTYSGSATSAVCRVYGYDAGCKVELVENGAVVKTVTFPNCKDNRPYQAGQEVSAVVAALNTRAGWTFTEIGDNTGWSAWAFNNGTRVDFECKNVVRTWKAGIDTHTEYLQQYAGDGQDENYIIWNNVIRDAFYTSCYFNDDTARDSSIKFNVFDVTPGGLDSAGSSQWGLGKHLLIENNFLHDGVREAHAAGKDAYSSFRQNITTSGPERNSAGVWPAQPGYQDNIWPPSADGQPAGANDRGNIAVANAAAVYALFVNRAAGDYRPAAGSLLLANKKTSLRTFDARGNALAASDCIGPWADGFSAPTWAF